MGQQRFVCNGSAKLPGTRQGGLLLLAWWFFRSHLACVPLLLLSNCCISVYNCICLGGIQRKIVCLLFSLFPQKCFICSTLSFFSLWFMPPVYLLTPLSLWHPVPNNKGSDWISFHSEMGEGTNSDLPIQRKWIVHKMSLLCLCSRPKKPLFPCKAGRGGKKEMIRLSPRGRRESGRWYLAAHGGVNVR